MKRNHLSLVFVLCFALTSPLFAQSAIEVQYEVMVEQKLDIYETSLENFVAACVAQVPGMESAAISRYELHVKNELNKQSQNVARQLNKFPKLRAQFKQMYNEYLHFVDTYAELCASFMRTDFESGFVYSANIHPDNPNITKVRMKFAMLRVLNRYLRSNDPAELDSLCKEQGRAQRTFKELHTR